VNASASCAYITAGKTVSSTYYLVAVWAIEMHTTNISNKKSELMLMIRATASV